MFDLHEPSANKTSYFMNNFWLFPEVMFLIWLYRSINTRLTSNFIVFGGVNDKYVTERATENRANRNDGQSWNVHIIRKAAFWTFNAKIRVDKRQRSYYKLKRYYNNERQNNVFVTIILYYSMWMGTYLTKT